MPSFKELLWSAWGVYQARWPVYISIAAVLFLLPVILTILGLTSVMGPGNLSASGMAGLGALADLLVIAAIIVGFWANLALIYSVKHRDWAEVSNFRASFKNTVKLIWPLIWTGALGLLALIGALIPLVVPAVIVWIGLAFVSYVVAIEGRRGLAALLRSRQLVTGQFTYVFWRVFVIGLLVGALSQAIVWILAGAGVQEPIANLVTLLVALVLLPLVVAYMVLLYEQLAKSKPAESFQENPSDRRRYWWLCFWGAVAMLALAAAVLGAFVWWLSRFGAGGPPLF